MRGKPKRLRIYLRNGLKGKWCRPCAAWVRRNFVSSNGRQRQMRRDERVWGRYDEEWLDELIGQHLVPLGRHVPFAEACEIAIHTMYFSNGLRKKLYRFYRRHQHRHGPGLFAPVEL